MSISFPLRQYFGYSKKFKRFDIVVGADNITSNKNNDIIINSENPFSADMDGGIREGNAIGSRLYTGLKIGF